MDNTNHIYEENEDGICIFDGGVNHKEDNSNNPNPEHSPTKQLILDLLACGFNQNIALYEVLDLLERKPEVQKTVDECFNNHRYPDKKIQYSQISNHRTGNAMPALAANNKSASAILQIMIHWCSGTNNYIQISVPTLMDILKVKKRNIVIDGLKFLKDNGYIRTVIPSKGQKPPTYQINPAIVWSGKKVHKVQQQHVFNKAADKEALNNFKQMNESMETTAWGKLKIDMDDKSLTVSTIQEIEKKEPLATDSKDSKEFN